MLCQFSQEGNHITLASLPFSFPKDVYPLGRLDTDSEGLIVLSNDTSLNKILLSPTQHVVKTYWAQVEGIPTAEALTILRQGVNIRLPEKGFYQTKPCQAQMIDPLTIPERTPPIRFRKNIPTTWLEIQIHEGKNRQVRKMCAKIGFPVLRLIRVGVGKLHLNQYPHLATQQIIEIGKKDL